MSSTTLPATLPKRRPTWVVLLPGATLNLGLSALLAWVFSLDFSIMFATMTFMDLWKETGKRLEAEQRAAGITLAIRNAAQAMRTSR